MGKEERVCQACGRPLTGRQRKWCDRPDCGGWDAVHPPITKTCECGRTFDTYKGSGKDKCPICSRNMVERTCIQCGKTFTIAESRNFLWCEGRDLKVEVKRVDGEWKSTHYELVDGKWEPTTGKSCYDKYFRENPQPDYFVDDRALQRKGLCFGCEEELDEKQKAFGYCSATCDAIYQVRSKFRKESLRQQIQEEEGELAAKVFDYAWIKQWFEVHPDHAKRWGMTYEGYKEEYRRAYNRESRRRKKENT